MNRPKHVKVYVKLKITSPIRKINKYTRAEYKKLHSLQSLVRTTRRTKTANISKHYVTSASHRQKVTVLQN